MYRQARRTLMKKDELDILARKHCVFIFEKFNEQEVREMDPVIRGAWQIGQRITNEYSGKEMTKNESTGVTGFYDNLVFDNPDFDELEEIERIVNKIKEYGFKIKYSVQDTNNNLIDPGVRAFIGKKTVVLGSDLKEMESPRYVDIAIWVDELLGELSEYFVFNRLEHNGDKADVVIAKTPDGEIKLKENNKATKKWTDYFKSKKK